MSNKESDHDMPDAEPGSSDAEPNGKTVDFGELKVSGKDDVAAGVAAGNIHLQSANAATLALPEVRFSPVNTQETLGSWFKRQRNVLKCCYLPKLVSGKILF